MSSKEYLKQYRKDNPDKYKRWDKQQRDKHKIRMQMDEEYRELYMQRRRESCRNRRAKIKADPELSAKQKVLNHKYYSNNYEKRKKLKRVLNNMKTINIDKQSRVRISSRYGSSSKNITLSPTDEKRLIEVQKSLGLYKTTLSFILSMLILEQGKLYMELCRLKGISIE